MAKGHDWQWKALEKGYLVVCADCGVRDEFFTTEEKANERVKVLKRGRTGVAARFAQQYGLNRSMRYGRKVKWNRDTKSIEK